MFETTPEINILLLVCCYYYLFDIVNRYQDKSELLKKLFAAFSLLMTFMLISSLSVIYLMTISYIPTSVEIVMIGIVSLVIIALSAIAGAWFIDVKEFKLNWVTFVWCQLGSIFLLIESINHLWNLAHRL